MRKRIVSKEHINSITKYYGEKQCKPMETNQRNVSVVIRRAFSQTNIIIINYLDIGVIGFK